MYIIIYKMHLHIINTPSKIHLILVMVISMEKQENLKINKKIRKTMKSPSPQIGLSRPF